MGQRPPIPVGPYLVVGLARSGIAAARALRAHGEQTIGLDAGAPAAAESLREDGVDVFLNDEDGRALLDRVRAVVKSPGVPAQAAPIVAARERGLPVIGELELAWRLLGNELVAVTGTYGKTTTVELIGHVHREAGVPVAVAGNVGTALSSLVGALEPAATIVCEASSFQLEDAYELAPEAAVLLNVTPDHLDRHGTLADYTAAKLRLFARQRPGDIAVFPRALTAVVAPALADGVRAIDFDARDRAAAMHAHDGWLWWREQPLVALAELRLRGAHNVENAMAAAAVCLAREIDVEAVRGALGSFTGVAHRLEEVAELEGVLYVNDSKATNVASTLVALDAFADRPVHLIVGGQGKGQDFAPLRAPIERGCAAVYAIGEDASKIVAALDGVATPVSEQGDLEHALLAVRSALRAQAPGLATAGAASIDAAAQAGLTAPGTAPKASSRRAVVLLSPASASFDQFADFEARGARFRELVEKLQG